MLKIHRKKVSDYSELIGAVQSLSENVHDQKRQEKVEFWLRKNNLTKFTYRGRTVEIESGPSIFTMILMYIKGLSA